MIPGRWWVWKAATRIQVDIQVLKPKVDMTIWLWSPKSLPGVLSFMPRGGLEVRLPCLGRQRQELSHLPPTVLDSPRSAGQFP